MATCQECDNYESLYGPTNASYCKAFRAKINDADNPEGGKNFATFWQSGWSATSSCPYGQASPDYD